MKTLYIAEKPDIGKALANYLWPNGNFSKEKGYFYNENTAVTWAVGHILALAEPEAYGDEFKSWGHYPIIPDRWILKPPAATAAQLAVIKKLLGEVETVIHAGDPDREGQLLIDEILRYFNYKNEVKRILINAKDDESMKRAFDQIVENKKYENLYYAGLGREQADWLVGMNLTRAYTVNARKYGYENTFRIGRVKIPTLALVVNREKQIKNFKATKYFELKGTFDKDGIPFIAMLKPSDQIPLDEEDRIKDKEILKAIKLKLEKASVIVKNIEEKDLLQNPPLPHSLDTLQIEANKHYGYSPKEVLDTVQSLYEKKFVSYPRSDCNYIPMSQKDDAIKILPNLKELEIIGADNANLSLTSKAFNDNKITAHHAIIPTGIKPNALSEIEQKIYELIAKNYILQFYPPYKFKKVTFTLAAGDETFIGSGKIVKDLGFKFCDKDEDSTDENDENIKLPDLHIGDQIDKAGYAILDKTTKPPKRFTEGSLLAAMANIWRYIDAKSPSRDKLKEVKGIGTPATRDTIISELQQDKNKGRSIDPCMKKVKKELVPTDFGIKLIENIDESFTVPDTTADMEYALSEIAAGKKTLTDYMDEVTAMVYKNIQFAESKKFAMMPGKKLFKCPFCESDIIRKYSQKAKKYFHICSNEKCVSPVTGKNFFYEDDHGEPIMIECPSCKNILSRVIGKNGPFWLCAKCKNTFNDKSGKPDLAKK